MADLSITAANVLPGAGAVTEDGLAGATITAGQAVYRDTDNSYKLADADAASALIRTARGIALNGAAAGQPLKIQKSGEITIGATLTGGTTYYLSGAAGGICPLADVGTGEYFHIVGIAKSTTVMLLALAYSGVSG
ncbi:hypothetical protein ABIB99_005886 [Bradyrhizobium sp. LA6.1]|uniref:hypothetical protein n=1 Tax=Bradyrhizobium sp. LA6.1 TaxID=3156378 RepID=UPI0033934A6E